MCPLGSHDADDAEWGYYIFVCLDSEFYMFSVFPQMILACKGLNICHVNKNLTSWL